MLATVPYLAFAMSLSVPSDAANRPPLVIANFEDGDYRGWTLTGTAFGSQPAVGTLSGQQTVSGFRGKGLVNSFHGGDGAVGTLTSAPFRIERRFIQLLVGGGEHPDHTFVKLMVDGKVMFRETGTASTGADDEHLSLRTWDVSKLQGKEAQMIIVDNHKDGWGHLLVDEIVQTDQSIAQGANASIARAMASVAGAAQRAQSDPLRPGFHLAPPALWCNDPNGPIYHEGWYHVFYQHNPYGDRWEHMHWGHARSRDLVHWEHLPIALWPSKEQGEDHVFSGSAAVNGKGEVMLFYTSIGKRAPEQWVAIAEDKDLIRWRKDPANPILTETVHGSKKMDDWRDPYVFAAEGKSWMVVGGHPQGEKGGAFLYEATNEDLRKWAYRGVAFQGTENNWECPNLFLVGEQALLLYSPHDRVKYYTGSLNLKQFKFEPRQHGSFDFGGDFYATSAFRDDNGAWIVWGWVRGFPGGRGWNGCLSLPRSVNIDKDGKLQQKPIHQLQRLREKELVSLDNVELSKSRLLDGVTGEMLEAEIEIELGTAKRCGIKLRRSEDGKEAATVFVDPEGVEVAGERGSLAQPVGNRSVMLHLFLDRSVLEVFADDECAVTKVIRSHPGSLGVELFADDGVAKIRSLRLWKLRAAEFTAGPIPSTAAR